MRVVVGDDSYPQRQWTLGQLRLLGHQVVAMATNALATYRECAELKPDLVILDSLMAPGSGKDIAQKIAREHLAARVLIITSEPWAKNRNTLQTVFAPLGIKVVAKPLTEPKFEAIIREIEREPGA